MTTTYLEVRARYITETYQQGGRWVGPVEYVAVSCEKFIQLIMAVKGPYAIVT
jgi:hypothetical protein